MRMISYFYNPKVDNSGGIYSVDVYERHFGKNKLVKVMISRDYDLLMHRTRNFVDFLNEETKGIKWLFRIGSLHKFIEEY